MGVVKPIGKNLLATENTEIIEIKKSKSQ